MMRGGSFRLLVVLAGMMGAAGVALAAASAHQPDATRLASASSMLLFHASAVLVVAAALFAGDLTLRQYAGHSLFPMAAPTGGTLLIVSWLMLAVAAGWPRRGV
jgi:uncharacterized membrane protein YgdD (TMEM256/DUF423 family)